MTGATECQGGLLDLQTFPVHPRSRDTSVAHFMGKEIRMCSGRELLKVSVTESQSGCSLAPAWLRFGFSGHVTALRVPPQ